MFGNNAKETGVAPDVWRYYLLKNRPESGDTQFEWRSFIDGNNSELLAKLGNFVNRVIKLVHSKYGDKVPDQFNASELPSSVSEPLSEVTDLLKLYLADMEAVRLRAGLLTAMKVAEAGNGLIQAHRLDNKLIEENPTLAASVVGTVLNLIYLCSAIFEPYLPATCVSIREQLASPFLLIPSEDDIKQGWKPTYLTAGHRIGKAAYLFTKIDEKKADEWREMFGGNQEERRKKQEEAEKVAAKKATQKEKTKAKKKEKSGPRFAGVEASAKGGQEGKTIEANGVVKTGEDAAVDKVVDGVAQVTIPSS